MNGVYKWFLPGIHFNQLDAGQKLIHCLNSLVCHRNCWSSESWIEFGHKHLKLRYKQPYSGRIAELQLAWKSRHQKISPNISSKGAWLGGSVQSFLGTVAADLARRKHLGICQVIEWSAKMEGKKKNWQTAQASFLPQGTQIQVLNEWHGANSRQNTCVHGGTGFGFVLQPSLDSAQLCMLITNVKHFALHILDLPGWGWIWYICISRQEPWTPEWKRHTLHKRPLGWGWWLARDKTRQPQTRNNYHLIVYWAPRKKTHGFRLGTWKLSD